MHETPALSSQLNQIIKPTKRFSLELKKHPIYRKIVLSVAIAILSLSMTACGNGNTDTPPTPMQKPASTPGEYHEPETWNYTGTYCHDDYDCVTEDFVNSDEGCPDTYMSRKLIQNGCTRWPTAISTPQ